MKSSTSPKKEARPLHIEKCTQTGLRLVIYADTGDNYGVYTSRSKAQAAVDAYKRSFE